MFSSNSRSKFYDDPTAINLLKAMSKSVSIISGHPLGLNFSQSRSQSYFIQGLRHADENGGTGIRRQRSQDFLQRVNYTKNRKLSGFGPLFS